MGKTDEVEVIISKQDWENLKLGYLPTVENGVKVLKLFSPDILCYIFGGRYEEKIVRVRISKVK